MQQLAGPSDTLSGGRLVRVEDAEGLTYQALIEADLLRFTVWQPHRGSGGPEGRDTCKGTGAYPPFLSRLRSRRTMSLAGDCSRRTRSLAKLFVRRKRRGAAKLLVRRGQAIGGLPPRPSRATRGSHRPCSAASGAGQPPSLSAVSSVWPTSSSARAARATRLS